MINLLSTLCVFFFACHLASADVEQFDNTENQNSKGQESVSFNFRLHPQAAVLYQDEQADVSYQIALGTYKKRNNRWRLEKSLQKQGRLSRYTLELPRDYKVEEVFVFYQDQLPEQAELLFSCEKRRCGESNNWANDYFKIKQLYGTDRSQRYAVFKQHNKNADKQGAVTTTYITIYSVRRGNRRLYTQLELLTTPGDE